MDSHTSPEPDSVSPRLFVGLFASFPFALLQLVFLSDPYGWAVFLFGYLGVVLVAPVVFLAWCAYCFVEWRVRRSYGHRPAPSFAIAGGILLLGFFVPALVVNPIAREIPYFCRVTQSIEWPTSKPNAEWPTNHRFVLGLVGKGTETSHRFTTGYMNWTGDEPAGFTSLSFGAVSFQERYYEDSQAGSLEYLKSRMANSGIREDELEAISKDVWQVLTGIDGSLAVRPEIGVVDDIYCHVDDEWDYVIGGWIWVFALIIVFLCVGYRSIGRFKSSQETG